jgi:hypothetical protein
MKWKVLLLFLLLFGGMPHGAAEQSPGSSIVVKQDGEDFIQAVVRGGCNPTHLSQIMFDNHLTTQQLLSFPTGSRIILFSGCGVEAVPEEAQASMKIIDYVRAHEPPPSTVQPRVLGSGVHIPDLGYLLAILIAIGWLISHFWRSPVDTPKVMTFRYANKVIRCLVVRGPTGACNQCPFVGTSEELLAHFSEHPEPRLEVSPIKKIKPQVA